MDNELGLVARLSLEKDTSMILCKENRDKYGHPYFNDRDCGILSVIPDKDWNNIDRIIRKNTYGCLLIYAL